MSITTEQTQRLEQRLATIKEQADQIQKELEGMKQTEWNNPERIKGHWYKSNFGKALIIYQGGLYDCIGFDYNGNWTTGYSKGDSWNQWRLATRSEVEVALIAEAGKRYKATDKIKSLRGIGTVYFNDRYVSIYKPGYDTLEYMGNMVYSEGEWAEVIVDKTLYLGSYPISFEGNFALINDKKYHKNFWVKLNDLIVVESYNSVISGVTVSKELITDIIKRLNN